MSEPLFHTSCPSCGAPVHVHSATAVTVVCGYCNSMLVRQDNSLHDTGRDSALLTDFSPLQIGTMGRFGAKNFALIGRLQVRYDGGMWNEWYARFDDGTNGWLSEVGDIYVLVREIQLNQPLPEFHSLRAGESTIEIGKRFVASDVRQIILENAAAQGELPFRLPEVMNNRVADFRCENAFLTLDYDTQPPTAFMGKTVKLADLVLQNTRDEHQIRQSAGSLKGSRVAENCPSCGSPIHWVGGVSNTVICGSCGSDIKVSEGKAKLREANVMRQAQETALPLPIGRKGKIRGNQYVVIGAVRYEEIDSLDAWKLMANQAGYVMPVGWWREYLLYSPQKGFLWLVETHDDEWFVSETLHDFPRLNQHNEVVGLSKLYTYGGRVSYAAGAFYWHIRAGDVNHYTDYQQGSAKICAELSRHELAYSRSVPMTRLELEAFGLTKKANSQSFRQPELRESVETSTRIVAMVAFVILNAPAWLMMSADDFTFSLFVSGIALWILYQSGQDSD